MKLTLPYHKILLFHLLNYPHWCGACSWVVTLNTVDVNNFAVTAPCFEQCWSLRMAGVPSEGQNSAPGAGGQSLTPLGHCCHLPCCGQLLCNTLGGCWQALVQLKPRRTGQFRQQTPTCASSGTSVSPHRATVPASREWSEVKIARGQPETSADAMDRSRRQPLSMALPCVMERLCPLSLPTAAVCNLRFLQFRQRKVEGNLANIIRTCQVFFSIFIYVQWLSRSSQMPGMYCSLEELQYPAVFNVKGKPFH